MESAWRWLAGKLGIDMRVWLRCGGFGWRVAAQGFEAANKQPGRIGGCVEKHFRWRLGLQFRL